MYPRNAASPERLAIGAVVQISDGAVQTSGVSVSVTPQGGSAAASSGTISYVQGVVHYTPTQAETNYSSFTVTAYKSGCIPVSITVVTTESATAGRVVVGTNNDKSGYALSTAPPTASAIRSEIDSNSTQLAALASRLSATRAGYLDFLASDGAGLINVQISGTKKTLDALNDLSVGDAQTGAEAALDDYDPATANALATAAASAAAAQAAAEAVQTQVGIAGAGLTNVQVAGTLKTLDALAADQEGEHTITQDKIDLVKAVTDKLDTSLEDDGASGWQLTTLALENAPAGSGGGPTAAQIADAVWTEPIADHSGTAGSTAESLNAAGGSGDPWITTLPGSYTGAQAGKILADILDDVTGLDGDAMRGTDGAYTGTPPTASEIRSEIDSNSTVLLAITGYIDTEVAAIKAVTDKLDTSLEVDGSGGWQFTTLAVENAPAGSGGGGGDVNVTEIAGVTITAQMGAGFAHLFDVATPSKTMNQIGTAVSGGAGTGARTVTVTVDDGSSALENAVVRMTEGANTYTATTNASGQVVFNLDDATYTVAIYKAGYTYSGTDLAVSADASVTYSMAALATPTPSSGEQTTVYLYCYDQTGAVESGVNVSLQLTQVPAGDSGKAYDVSLRTGTSNASGYVEFTGCWKGAEYLYYRGGDTNAQYQHTIAADAGDNYQLPSIRGT